MIALHPAPRREDARLMVLDRASGAIRQRTFSGLVEALGPGDLLVMNDTRVFPARMIGTKEATGAKGDGGGRVEVLFVREVSPGVWEVLLRRRLKAGQRIRFGEGPTGEGPTGEGPTGEGLVAEVVASSPDCRLRIEGRGSLLERLERIGQVPLPPYITRPAEPSDRERYQTVYARRTPTADGQPPGSVAAPTAGLHFSERLLGELAGRGVVLASLTLHIGPGTFRSLGRSPGRSTVPSAITMAAEYMEIPEATISILRRAVAGARRVVAVGTSTARALETMGDTMAAAAGQTDGPIRGWTGLTIAPGHVFRVVGALVTNFHLPGSTPLRLTTAFAGEAALRHAYAEAMQARYRLLSYGDAMLIL